MWNKEDLTKHLQCPGEEEREVWKKKKKSQKKPTIEDFEKDI